jgi:hypothetical protein
LNTITGLRLPATLVFDYPNSSQIARYLLEQVSKSLPSPTNIAEDQLNRLAKTLSAITGDNTQRNEIAARLRSLASTLAVVDQRGLADQADGDDLKVTTDDELFDLIDQSFGEPE